MGTKRPFKVWVRSDMDAFLDLWGSYASAERAVQEAEDILADPKSRSKFHHFTRASGPGLRRDFKLNEQDEVVEFDPPVMTEVR